MICLEPPTFNLVDETGQFPTNLPVCNYFNPTSNHGSKNMYDSGTNRMAEQALISILNCHETKTTEHTHNLFTKPSLGRLWRARRELNPGPPGFHAEACRLKARCSVLTELRAHMGLVFSVCRCGKGVF